MAVSSLKGCWCKFSARIREYLDVVDSYYRPGDLDSQTTTANKGLSRQTRTHNYCKTNHHHRRINGSITGSGVTGQQVSKYQCSSKPQLPPGFSKKKTSQGQIFFVSTSGERLWYDPSVPKELIDAPLDLDNLIGRLSSNWEIRHTHSGKTYYVNHLKKTTQFTDPRLVAYRDFLYEIFKHATKYGDSPGDTTAAYQLPNNATGQVSHNVGSQQIASLVRPRQASTMNNHLGNDSSTKSLQSEVRNNCNQSDGRSERTALANSHVRHHQHSYYHNHGSLNRTKNTATTHSGYPYNGISTCRPNQTLNDYPSPHSQRQINSLSGSHHNLSMSSNQLASLTRIQGSESTNLARNLVNEGCDLSPSDIGQTTSKSRSNQQQRSGSFANLTSLSANSISSSVTVERIANSTSGNQQANNKVDHKELYDKISILRQELFKQQVITHPCRIDVNRNRIFEESFRVVSQLQPRDLKKRLLVKFKGEEGLDYGGVAREWFYLLSRDILNPAHGLFQYTSDDIYNLQINPDSGIVYREHLSYLNFCGRIIGMAVFHGHFIEGHFTLPFYKMLLRKPISLSDIEFVDPELYRSLCWMLENDITDIIDTTFLVQHNAFGKLQELELKDGGKNIIVTEENKHEYVSLYVNYRCRRGIESQMEALQRGFYELISPSLVDNFNEAELELLIGGLSKINVEDWRRHTKLKNCTIETPLVEWFWDIVRSYGEDKRARLLQFVTGSPRVPIQGFKALQGVNSELRLFTIHLIKNACTDNLPKSHTCFNRIDLPPYETYDKLRDKLTQAIEETMGFAMQ